ncbi:hypothetical protein ACFIQF_00185 [Comamonas sp. J-3]|uniref:hypothetical protein n=1 Tax=Comamonas trifloxystrobinivorans TaxID=3350256 RepID=UPI00372C306F
MSIRKSQAIEILGGSVSAAALAMGISYQAVDQWPELLSNRLCDRVLAAWARQHVRKLPAPFQEIRARERFLESLRH